MSMKEKTAVIETALENLGYKDVRELRITCPTERRANVFLNDEYIGIYDFARGTFVD
mgnify:CR=1 FL=1